MRLLIFFVALFFNGLINLPTGKSLNSEKSKVGYYVSDTITTEIHPISVGDTCPDFTMSNIVNYPKRSAKLSDFKGKWLILDFWFTTCAPCIGMLPKTQVLQEKFNDRLQFMPVTFNNEAEVMELFSRMNEGKGLTLPSVTVETSKDTLRKLFLHLYSPHYVWIDPDGVVKAITDHNSVNEENITWALSGKQLQWETKNDFTNKTVVIDRSKPLLVDGNGGDERQIITYSVITKSIEGQPSFLNISQPNKLIFVNSSILTLFRVAYSEYGDNPDQRRFPFNRIILEVQDSSRLVLARNATVAERDEWKKSNQFCYNLILPDSYAYHYNDGERLAQAFTTEDFRKKFTAVRKMMRQDLERAFGITASVEKRVLPCYALTVVDRKLFKNSTSKGSEFSLKYDKGTYLDMKGGTMKDLLSPFVASFSIPIPVFDDTGAEGKFDISLIATMYDIEKVNLALQKYGLKFKKTNREMDALVIVD